MFFEFGESVNMESLLDEMPSWSVPSLPNIIPPDLMAELDADDYYLLPTLSQGLPAAHTPSVDEPVISQEQCLPQCGDSSSCGDSPPCVDVLPCGDAPQHGEVARRGGRRPTKQGVRYVRNRESAKRARRARNEKHRRMIAALWQLASERAGNDPRFGRALAKLDEPSTFVPSDYQEELVTLVLGSVRREESA